MPNRRTFACTAAALGASWGGAGCADGSQAYAAAAQEVRQPPATDGPAAQPAVLRHLVRAATLAPNSHNTQPWRFALEPQALTVRPDPARRCPVVDPDDHHLWVSLGCAVENIVWAARAQGLEPEVDVDTTSLRVRVALQNTTPRVSPLAQAIPRRQSTRSEFDGQRVNAAEVRALEQAAAGGAVTMQLLDGAADIERIVALVAAGNDAQAHDPAFVAELTAWIRFNAADALRTRDGLYTRCSGQPELPPWLGRRLLPWVYTAKGETDRATRQLRSSAAVAVFSSPTADPAGWMDVGRAFERFALQATVLGLRVAHLNQPVEVPAVRRALAAQLQLGSRLPDLLVRIGRGPAMPMSLRRPLDDVID